MFQKICVICGKPFESPRSLSKYCLNCRAKAYREKATRNQRERRAEMRAAEVEITRQEREEAWQRQQAEYEAREAKRIEELRQKAENGDLLARLSLAIREPGYLFSLEYWRAFQAYKLDFDGDHFETVVNGISVKEEKFAEIMVESMEICPRIVTATIFNNHKKGEKENNVRISSS